MSTSPMASGMRGYRVTLADMQDIASQTDATAAEIESQLNALRNFVVDLEAQWHGVASQTFNALMNDWGVYATMLHQSLVGIASGLRGNWANYTQSEESNIGNLQTVHGSLPGGPVGTARLD